VTRQPGAIRQRVLLLLALAAALGLAYRVMFVPSPRGEVLAYTECSFGRPPSITLSPALASEDTQPVRVHEETHASQCRELGALRYRLRNFTARGRLSLEAPAYCAGARSRLRAGGDPKLVRERLVDDVSSAFASALDAATVRAALRSSCPDLAG